MTDTSDIAIRRGTGNLFADIGFTDPDTHLLKAQLVTKVHDIVRERGLTRTEAGRLVGLSQPDLHRLLKGRSGTCRSSG